jgi:AcrR family transcriptional regulator
MSSLVSTAGEADAATGSGAPVPESPRRALSPRQAATVDELTEAAMAELTEVGESGLSVRNVARRAGVAPATAYNYFASKEHLIAEVFWRRFQAQPDSVDRRRGPAGRALAALESFALVVADETQLAAACTVAVLADDPDVAVLRERIGLELHRRVTDALGADADPDVVEALQLCASGALIRVGTGHGDYSELPELLERMCRVIVGDAR